MARYVIIKPNVGGTAFWRSMFYYLRDGEHRVIRLRLHSRAYLYLFPIESMSRDTFGHYTWNSIIADISHINWQDKEELIVIKKTVKYTDEWGFENEAAIIRVRTRDNEYIVYPNKRIEELLTGRNQTPSSYKTVSDPVLGPGAISETVGAPQHQTLRSSRTTESNSDLGPGTVSYPDR